MELMGLGHVLVELDRRPRSQTRVGHPGAVQPERRLASMRSSNAVYRRRAQAFGRR